MNPPRPPTESHKINQVLIVTGFILALWVVRHPYLGVVHDARFYLLQTLHALEPARWSEDLFFKYGSQDAFSMFSNGYKWLVSGIGIAPANLLATVIGYGLWLSALGFLVCTILKRPIERLAAVCGVIALSTGYGGLGILHYAEPFVTPRLFAEAVVMGSLAFAAKRQYIRASMLCFLAFAIHPLTTLPGVGLVAFHALRRDRRIWIILGLALLVCMIGAGSGIDPLSRVTQFYTADWFHVVSTRNSMVLISAWHATDYARLAVSCITLGAFLTVADGRERRLTISILAVTFLSCAVSFLGADIAHNVLITSLQLWRVLWITNLVSNAAILLLLLRVDGTERAPLVTAIIFSFLPGFLFATSTAAPFIVVLCVLWFLHKKLSCKRVRFLAAISILIPMVFVFALLVYSLYLQITLDRHIGRSLLNLTLATTAVLGAAWSIRHPRNTSMAVAAVGILVVSMPLADRQSNWNQYVYGSRPDNGLTEFLVGSGATFWAGDNGTELLWFKARKPSYFSCLQGAQAVFIHSLATEWSRRAIGLHSLNIGDFSKASCKLKTDGPGSRVDLAAACQSLPDLDTIVLNHPVPGLPGPSWTAPAYQEITEYNQGKELTQYKRVRISTFYRYDCAALRRPPYE